MVILNLRCCAVSSFPKLGARAWATDYVIAIKGKIEKPRTSKRYGIVRVRSFDMGSADSRQDDQVKTLARAWNMVVCGRFHARNTADETRQ